MPLDFGLLGGAPRINTPFENLSQILQVRNQQQAAQGLAEERQGRAEERRMKAAQAQQEAQQAAQFKALWSRTDPATGQPVMPTLEESAQIIGPENAAKVFKGLEEVQKAKWDNQQAAVQGVAAILDGVEAWPASDRQTAYDGARKTLIAQGKLKPEDAPERYDASWVAQMQRQALTAQQRFERDKPKADYTLGESRISGETNQPIATATPKVTYGAPQTLMVNGRRSAVRAGSDGRMYDMNLKPIEGTAIAPEPRIEAQGPQPSWQWVVRDGKEVYTNRVSDGDKPQNARVKATEDERKTAGFYGQMSDSIKTIDELESAITEKELYQIQTLPQEALIGMANRNQLSEAAKRYLRAFEQFTEARLRPVSGAAINDSEYARDRRTYAKQYGETPKLAEDRKNARFRALDALKKRAGVALDDASTAPGQRTTGAPPKDPMGIR